MKLALAFRPGRRMSLEEIEREAAAEIQSRVDAGKPPAEEWAALGDDRESLNVDTSAFGEWESEPTPSSASSSPPAAAEVSARQDLAEAKPVSVPEATPLAMPAAAAAPARKPARKPAARKPAARKPAARKPATSKPASATKAKAKAAVRRAASG